MNTNIQALLQTPQAKEVLRRHHVTATGTEAIRQGYAKKGDLFMYDLMKSVSPKTSVLHGNLGGADEYGMNDNWWESTADPYSEDKPKRSIEDWMSLLGQAGTIIGGIKQNVLGKVSDPSTPDPSTPDKKNNTLIWVIVAILLIGLAVIGYQSFKS